MEYEGRSLELGPGKDGAHEKFIGSPKGPAGAGDLIRLYHSPHRSLGVQAP